LIDFLAVGSLIGELLKLRAPSATMPAIVVDLGFGFESQPLSCLLIFASGS
jgi:hypothetical protein